MIRVLFSVCVRACVRARLNVAYFFPLFDLDFYYLPIRSAPQWRLFGQTWPWCGQNEIETLQQGLGEGPAAVGKFSVTQKMLQLALNMKGLSFKFKQHVSYNSFTKKKDRYISR